jgi:hypothetical protein
LENISVDYCCYFIINFQYLKVFQNNVFQKIEVHRGTSSTAAHQSETADIDEVADSLRQANTGMEDTSGGKRAADSELANSAKRQMNTDSGLEADSETTPLTTTVDSMGRTPTRKGRTP